MVVMKESYSRTFDRRRTTRDFLCALLALLLAAGDAFAQQPAYGKDTDRDLANWERVNAIGPNKESEWSSDRASATIRTYRGRLLKWEPDGLVLQLGTGAEKEIGKPLVQRVSLREKARRGKAAAITGAVGFGAGRASELRASGALTNTAAPARRSVLARFSGSFSAGLAR
jgi:hypothetical protein